MASIGVGYLVAAVSQRSSKNKEGGGSSLMSSLTTPILTLSVILFIVLSAAAIALILNETNGRGEASWIPEVLLLGSLVLFISLGFLVDSNRLSLHYFYRDRLTEAYLRTNARVLREKVDRQGMPLINLRNDENLKLKNLGWTKLNEEEALLAHQDLAEDPPSVRFLRFDQDGDVSIPNPRSPYHLIVGALNLQGSNELVRKDLKSEHFIFSRNYIGSQSTGYVRTEAYRYGRTKLARAMTISAAAVGSGMGFSTFFAQSFLTTLLNLRLGYWMENPWFYRYYDKARIVHSRWKYWRLKMQGWRDMEVPDVEKEKEEEVEVKKEKAPKNKYRLYFDPKRRYTFWPEYLFKELFGMSSADHRLVNVSDGGHTGDNLGLIPLLRRRCQDHRDLRLRARQQLLL